jgi:hypothetical protein
MENNKIFIACHLSAIPTSSGSFILSEVGARQRITRLPLCTITDDCNSIDSISDKNSTYSELTLQYQLSQRVTTNSRTGLVHYRRMFNPFGEKFLTDKFGAKITYEYGKVSRPETDWTSDIWYLITSDDAIKELDSILDLNGGVIVAKEFTKTNIFSIWTLAQIGWVSVKSIITLFEVLKIKLSSKEFEFFANQMNHHNGHWCNNMIYADSETFKKYSEFLFDVLFEVENRLFLENPELIQPRMFGYFSEYMLKPWLLLNQIPATQVETICFKNLKTDNRI